MTDDADRLRRRILWTLPSGLYLLGSRAGEVRNLMTTSWAMQVATAPRLLAVSVETGALTHRLITDGGVFALSLLDRDDRPVVRRFVKPAEDDQDAGTLAGHAVFDAPSGAPVLAAAPAWLDCRVTDRVDADSHTLFVGEVTAWDAPGDLEHPVLRMEDTRMSYGG